MTQFRNRVVTDYWTLSLPSDWVGLEREGKMGIGFESPDGSQTIIVNTLTCEVGQQQDPGFALDKFEDSVREANHELLGDGCAIVYHLRSHFGVYLSTTLVGFDGQSRVGICAKKYASADTSIVVQIHDYDADGATDFETLWRTLLDEFAPVEETV